MVGCRTMIASCECPQQTTSVPGARQAASIVRVVGREHPPPGELELGVRAVVGHEPARLLADAHHGVRIADVVPVHEMHRQPERQQRAQRVHADHVAAVDHRFRSAACAALTAAASFGARSWLSETMHTFIANARSYAVRSRVRHSVAPCSGDSMDSHSDSGPSGSAKGLRKRAGIVPRGEPGSETPSFRFDRCREVGSLAPAFLLDAERVVERDLAAAVGDQVQAAARPTRGGSARRARVDEDLDHRRHAEQRDGREPREQAECEQQRKQVLRIGGEVRGDFRGDQRNLLLVRERSKVPGVSVRKPSTLVRPE